jgi:hypothetical protein
MKRSKKPKWFESKEKADTEKAREKERWKGEHAIQDMIDELGEDADAIRPQSQFQSIHHPMGGVIQVSPEALNVWGASADEVKRQYEQFNKSLQQATVTLNMKPDKSFYDAMMKGFSVKKITAINFERTPNWVDIANPSDLVPRYAVGAEELILTDQDGDALPRELEEKVRKLVLSNAGEMDQWVTTKLHELLAEHNEGPAPKKKTVSGHKSGCQYRGTHHWACTCQPSTIFGESLSWHCDCCERAAADIQYGLCDLCRSHQYGSKDQQDADHETFLA